MLRRALITYASVLVYKKEKLIKLFRLVIIIVVVIVIVVIRAKFDIYFSFLKLIPNHRTEKNREDLVN
jgi:hypothetical protein